ncbi:hypothetical protein D7C05_17680 [Salmonella enterica]|nr:hypothetical protein [Salmonella enterica]
MTSAGCLTWCAASHRVRCRLPLSCPAECSTHNDRSCVNATIFDRYGGADDFLDSQEMNNVYRSRTDPRN